MFGLLAACGGDDGGQPIVDGQGSGSGSATGFGGAVTLVLEDEGSVYASAAFYNGTPTLPPSCTTVTDGPCSLTTCPTPPTPAVTYDDAGAITITGGTPTTVMALGEAADHSYTYPLQDTGTIYTGTFAIAGTGAIVPAFTQSVTMPTAIEVDAPTNAAPMMGVRMGNLVSFTSPFDITGQPAISLPLHWNDDALPIGVQFAAAYGREDILLRLSAQLEQAAPWKDRHPPPTY